MRFYVATLAIGMLLEAPAYDIERVMNGRLGVLVGRSDVGALGGTVSFASLQIGVHGRLVAHDDVVAREREFYADVHRVAPLAVAMRNFEYHPASDQT